MRIRLPFGLDLMSILVGMAIVYFLIPLAMRTFARPSQSKLAN